MKATARVAFGGQIRMLKLSGPGKLAKFVKQCGTHAPSAPLYPWRWPTRVWQRVHISFAEKDGDYFLGLIDSHSKWVEVIYNCSKYY